MANTSTIVGKLHTPEDSNGNRKEILLRTTTDLVYDADTGTLLKDKLASVDNATKDATETTSGLASPTLVKNVNTLMQDQHVISTSQPTTPSFWFQVEDIETSS